MIPLENESQPEFENRINTLVLEGIQGGGRLRSLSRKQDSLEDVFVKQVGVLESRV